MSIPNPGIQPTYNDKTMNLIYINSNLKFSPDEANVETNEGQSNEA